MSITHTIKRSISLPGGIKIEGSVEKTSQQEIQISDNVPQSTGPTLYALAIDVSQLKSLFILSNTDLNLFTNANDGSGGDVLHLKAGQAVIWQQNDSVACPLTVDVTSMYLTAGAVGSAGADFNLVALVDPTV